MTEITLIYPSKDYECKANDYIEEFLKYKSEISGTGLKRQEHAKEINE